jgi:FKBP-type peptidyl-prolyl cis-trans isomerase FklB
MSRFLFLVVLAACIMMAFSAGEAEKAAQKEYLRKMSSKKGTITLKSGMVIEILQPSTKEGAKSPTARDSCECTYLGTFMDGSRFDGGTTSFAPNQVIKGWTEAMQYMTEGDKWKLHIPYELAYGERGRPPKIPAYSPLIFEIEIHRVKSGGKSADEAHAMLAAGTVTPAQDL